MVQERKKAEAVKLRLQGASYGEIMKALDIASKGTLSYWFSNLTLPAKAKKHLQHNVILARKRGLFAFNKKRTQNIIAENKEIFNESRKEISDISQDELLLIGAALYWAEGVNRELPRGYQNASFTNSDPRMVKVFMRYLREVLQISDKKIKPGIIVYPNLNLKDTKRFWSQVANLPQETFWVSVAVSKASKMKRPSHYLPYGTFHVKVHSRQLFYKIQGHIKGIIDRLQ